MRCGFVDGGRGRGLGRGPVGHGGLLLIHAVEPDRLQHVAFAEPVIEPSVAAADHSARGFVAVRAGRPRKRKTRRPVSMVADPVLRFVAQAIAQGEVGACLVVVLEIHTEIEIIHAQRGVSRCDAVLRRGIRSVGLATCCCGCQAGIRISSVESGVGVTGIVCDAQPPAEVNGVRALGHHGVVLQFIAILVIAHRPRAVAAAGERALH